MTNAMRLAAVAAFGVIISLAAGVADAHVHHHHHHDAAGTAPTDAHVRHHHHDVAAAAPTEACGRHHHHCHTAQVSPAQVACGHHHRHCHQVAASGETVACARHHRHCHTVASRRYPHADEYARASERTGDNGVCKSVRLHGEWVQQCNFANQGQ